MPVTFSEIVTNVSTYGGSDGSIIILVNTITGTAPYVYTLDGINKSSETFPNLTAKTYTVKVTDSKNQSSLPKNITITQPDPPVITIPNPPINPGATAVSSTQINVSWTDNSSNETGFKVESSPNNSTWTEITTVGAGVTSYQNTGLNASATYYYRIRSYNGAGNSAYTSSVNATTQAPPVTIPNPPINPAATAVSSTQINVSWGDNSNNETGFKIERSPNNSTWTEITTVGAGVTSYQNTGLTASTIYYYRIRSYNGAGNSAYTSSVNATSTYCIGEHNLGGIIAYIFQNGDPGYIVGQIHGIVITEYDAAGNYSWCTNSDHPSVSTSTILTSGQQNTININAGSYSQHTTEAANLCFNLSLNGYSDWWLPSKDELNKIYLNNLLASKDYWTSSQATYLEAWYQKSDGTQPQANKNVLKAVRPIRYF